MTGTSTEVTMTRWRAWLRTLSPEQLQQVMQEFNNAVRGDASPRWMIRPEDPAQEQPERTVEELRADVAALQWENACLRAQCEEYHREQRSRLRVVRPEPDLNHGYDVP